jgi:hypothetical protein
MTIKISELDALGVFFANTIVPVVGSVSGTLTTLRANGAVIKTFITSELVAADAVLSGQISSLTSNAGVQAGQISTLTSNAGVQAGQISTLVGNVDSLSNQITDANVNLKGYVDEQIATTAANASANAAIQAGEISSLFSNAASQATLISNATTQITTANTNMKGYVDSAISSNVSAIINGAPGALDTLNELANALGNDAIFSTTVTNTLANITSNVNSLSDALNSYSPNVQVDAYYASTPLTSAQGGTGLATPGTSGNVLTSNGNVWVSAGVIGVNQTWQDLTSSRAFATTYTNNTGKPILVNVTGALSSTGTASANIYLEVDSVIVAQAGGRDSFTQYHFVSAIVPNGSSYRVVNGGGDVLHIWAELR